MSTPFSLEGKRILVTGASSGIGRQIAISCSQMGAAVIGTGRDTSKLDETLNLLSGADHLMVPADLTQASGRDSVLAAIDNPLEGIVHCAGISRLSPVRMMTEAHLLEIMAINVNAPMLLTQGLLKKQKIQDGGSVLFISSIAAHIGVAGVAGYSGSKAALLAMMRCLAMEVVKRKIRVNCLSPSLVETPLFEAMELQSGTSSMEQKRNDHPLGFGKPEDIANASVFFLSEASRWITGTTLVMDGGLTIS
jgi:NAD(P)-dependent dehydrogenase (short-subunit alcohol dehydrogenase family)